MKKLTRLPHSTQSPPPSAFARAHSGRALGTRRLCRALTLTPRTTEGPYYPDHLPLDQDNDLSHVTNDVTPAIGTITNVGGRVLR